MTEKVLTRFASIGTSGRGRGMTVQLAGIEGVYLAAVCDKFADRAHGTAKEIEEKYGYKPAVYTDYREMLEKEEFSAVLISTTWITHARIAVDCMLAGRNVACEVGGVASVEEAWRLVRTSEKTGKFCMMMENCCYDRREMALFNMKKLGLFGDVVHVEGAYQHDLRKENIRGREERHGRLFNFMNRNGEVYPTHQLGPICKLLGVNRGNRMVSLVSMASPAKGLHDYIDKNYGPRHDLYGTEFTLGDVVTTMIKCAHGETILLTHECTLPRPYSRGYRIDGTNGIYMEDGDRIHIDGVSEEEKWEDAEPYFEKYAHPLWQEQTIKSAKWGHGGMDIIILAAFAEAAINEAKPPIDVYDYAAWASVTALSEQSIALGSHPVPVPDFTDGMWIDREPYRRGKFCLEEVCEDYFDL